MLGEPNKMLGGDDLSGKPRYISLEEPMRFGEENKVPLKTLSHSSTSDNSEICKVVILHCVLLKDVFIQ